MRKTNQRSVDILVLFYSLRDFPQVVLQRDHKSAYVFRTLRSSVSYFNNVEVWMVYILRLISISYNIFLQVLLKHPKGSNYNLCHRQHYVPESFKQPGMIQVIVHIFLLSFFIDLQIVLRALNTNGITISHIFKRFLVLEQDLLSSLL